jgi:predicted RNA-binding protein with TRAM domain
LVLARFGEKSVAKIREFGHRGNGFARFMASGLSVAGGRFRRGFVVVVGDQSSLVSEYGVA